MTDPTIVPSVLQDSTVTAPSTTADQTTSSTPAIGAITPTVGSITPMPLSGSTGLPGGWQVAPDQVAAFSLAVQQVRGDLDAVFNQVNELTSPTYQPQLGTSPVGQGLTAKFVDRLSGDQGLLVSMNAVLSHLDQFVSNAEQCAADYQEADTSTADTLQST